MQRNTRIILTLLFFFGYSIANTQWREYFFTTKGAEDGLTSNIYDMAQDSSGIMYFGTGQGLVRYDGKEFSHFYHDAENESSIGPGDVWNIDIGQDNVIWLGTRFGGLNAFSPEKGTFEHYPLPKINADDSPAVSQVLSTDSTVWVGGSHFRLHRFDIQTKEYKTYIPDWLDPNILHRRLGIVSILQDEIDDNILWLSVLDYTSPGAPEREFTGVVKFDKSTGTFESQPCDCRLKFQDEKGIIWGTSYGGGIWNFNPKQKIVFNINKSLKKKMIWFLSFLTWRSKKTLSGYLAHIL